MDAVINNPLGQSKPSRVWSLQETADLVDFLYKYRGQMSQGIIPDKAFQEATCHLGRKPHRRRSKKAIQIRFRNVRTFHPPTAGRLTLMHSFDKPLLRLTNTMQSIVERQILPSCLMLSRAHSLSSSGPRKL